MAEKEEILIEITIDNKEAIANEKRLIQEIEQSRYLSSHSRITNEIGCFGKRRLPSLYAERNL